MTRRGINLLRIDSTGVQKCKSIVNSVKPADIFISVFTNLNKYHTTAQSLVNKMSVGIFMAS